MPILLGAGQPLMSGNTGRVKLKLIKSDNSPEGILSLNYAVDHDTT
ncbi:MAG: hypothetical protein ACREUU_17170 [Gammaproteobacteria bacterium]